MARNSFASLPRSPNCLMSRQGKICKQTIQFDSEKLDQRLPNSMYLKVLQQEATWRIQVRRSSHSMALSMKPACLRDQLISGAAYLYSVYYSSSLLLPT